MGDKTLILPNLKRDKYIMHSQTWSTNWKKAADEADRIRNVTDLLIFYQSYDLQIVFSELILMVNPKIVIEFIEKMKDGLFLTEYMITLMIFKNENIDEGLLDDLIKCLEHFEFEKKHVIYSFIERYTEYNLMYPEHRMNEKFYNRIRQSKPFQNLTK